MSFSKKIINAAVFLVLTLGLVGGSFVVKAQPGSVFSDISLDPLDKNKSGHHKNQNQQSKKSKRPSKTNKNLAESTKTKIDPALTQALKKAQLELQTARKNLLEAKKANTSNLTELQAKVAEAKKAVKDAGSAVHRAAFKAKINLAKTVGIANYHK